MKNVSRVLVVSSTEHETQIYDSEESPGGVPDYVRELGLTVIRGWARRRLHGRKSVNVKFSSRSRLKG